MELSNNTFKFTTKILIVFLLVITSLTTNAQTWNWDGSDNSDYDNPANWEEGTAPPDGVDVYIHGNSDHYAIVDDFLITGKHLRNHECA